MFESILILEIYSLPASIESCSMTVKIAVINDKQVQNGQMAVIRVLMLTFEQY